MEWISVNDKLPGHGRAIVCGHTYNFMKKTAAQFVGEAFFDSEIKAFFWNNKPILDPTHWMPLPSPPKAD